jgi:hypothetical protein
MASSSWGAFSWQMADLRAVMNHISDFMRIFLDVSGLCVRVLQVLTSLIVRHDAIYRFGYVNSFGVSEPSPSHSVQMLIVGWCSPLHYSRYFKNTIRISC